MKSFIIVIFLVATLLQVEGRWTFPVEIPKVLLDTMHESIACVQVGTMPQIPQMREMGQLPEDDPVLNELWGCVLQKKGILDNHAVLSENKLEEFILDLVSMFGQPDLEKLTATHDMVQQCKDVHGNGYGQTAVKIQNCINRYIQARY